MVKSAFVNINSIRYVVIRYDKFNLFKILDPYFIEIKKAKTKSEIESIARKIMIILESNTDTNLKNVIVGIMNIISSYALINVDLNTFIIYPMVIPILKKSK